MKILHINTNDKGGAATACIRIHLELLQRGIDSKILFLHRTKTHIPETYAFKHNKPLLLRLWSKLKQLATPKSAAVREKFPEIEWFSDPTSPYDITQHPLYKEADIIQLNWVSGFLDEPSFFKSNLKPIVWRMPDLYACGGGYHYKQGFPFDKLQSRLDRNVRIRSRALRGQKITFVPISKWVQQNLNESPIIKEFSNVVIRNGLDFSVFKPTPKQEARSIWKLPSDKKIVLLGADINYSPRKGFHLAVAALDALKDENVLPVVFGKFEESLPDHFMQIGYISDENLLAKLYSASDYFLMTSIEEAFGQVTIEALSCGVPVVSFPNGGSLDIINENMNGVLASNFTPEALCKALKIALDLDFNSEAIVEDVRARFNIQDKIESYIRLYKTLDY